MSITRLRLFTFLVIGILGYMFNLFVHADMPKKHKSSQNLTLEELPQTDEIAYEYYLELHQRHLAQAEVDTIIRTILVCTELTKINIIRSQPQYCDKRQKKYQI